MQEESSNEDFAIGVGIGLLLLIFTLLFFFWGWSGSTPIGFYPKIDRLQEQMSAENSVISDMKKEIEVLRTQVNQMENHRHNFWGRVKL